MPRSLETLRSDALRIWWAGVDEVRADRLTREALHVESNKLRIVDEMIDLNAVRRIVVVGAGKAVAAMAEGVETAFGVDLLQAKQVAGWVNAPDDCIKKLSYIHVHGARPAGRNEPTEAGVRGTEEILKLVESLGADDLCLCLLSGGGSALLPAPVEGVSLNDKLSVTRFLSAAGANIAELNTVRKRLSRVKGGGLARAAPAGRIVTLVISDVPGNPLDVIASGPTTLDGGAGGEALAVLNKYDAREAGVSHRVFEALHRARKPEPCRAALSTHIIGDNARAVDAAGMEAERLGYSHAMQAANALEGPAEQVGEHLAAMTISMRDNPNGPDCLISGGEPTVKLPRVAERGRGGRNQQLALAAFCDWSRIDAEGMVLLSGGTDGEDGPTDAAGAMIDAEVIRRARDAGLDPQDFLRRCDAYNFFDPLATLLRTGPTHTNVCDLRVITVDRASS